MLIRMRLGGLFAIATGLFSLRPTLSAQIGDTIVQLECEVVALEHRRSRR